MALYVRDEAVNRLAEKARQTLGASTKTEAVRIALERLLHEEKKSIPLRERLKRIQQATLALGKPDREFNEKEFTDRLWGHE